MLAVSQDPPGPSARELFKKAQVPRFNWDTACAATTSAGAHGGAQAVERANAAAADAAAAAAGALPGKKASHIGGQGRALNAEAAVACLTESSALEGLG